MIRPNLTEVMGTDEDVACFAFRINRRTGSICCPTHHMATTLLTLAGDTIDAEIMYAGVRSCESMRWGDLPLSEWLCHANAKVVDPDYSRARLKALLESEFAGPDEEEPVSLVLVEM